MRLILLLTLLIPFLAYWISLLLRKESEKTMARLASGASLLQLICAVTGFILWLESGCVDVESHIITVYHSGDFDFGITLFYDRLTAVYLILTSFLLFIVSVFSRYYMHRENGYSRFFNHMLLFHTGLTTLVLAGNFETLFFGWEIVGISSFLLISFYRERYLPVRNALKVLSFYRLGDVSLLCAIWFFHHIAQGHFGFADATTNDSSVHLPIGFALLLVIAATIKSAQFPFSTWLPRAMEGPTSSSAIFYGSLSLHLGVFLLLRTAPMWAGVQGMNELLIAIGLITAVLSNLTTAVQPTMKTHIAYASVTQVGLMFIELGLGFYTLTLIHLSGHALLRTYQLLVSPSSMNYLTHHTFYHHDANKKAVWNKLPQKIRDTLYLMSVKEWGLDAMWYHSVWRPMKRVSKALHFLRKPGWIGVMLLFPIGILVLVNEGTLFTTDAVSMAFQTVGVLGLFLVMISWSERRSAIRAWVYITLSQLFFMLSIVQHEEFDSLQTGLYLGGIVLAFAMGYLALRRVERIENGIGLNEFHGHVYEHPGLAALFLVSSLMMIGFPLSPTFLGFDILFSRIGLHHPILVVTGFLTFVFLELSVLRIYARVFMGLHVKSYHEVAFRSS